MRGGASVMRQRGKAEGAHGKEASAMTNPPTVPPAPQITDAMVDAALDAWFDGDGDWKRPTEHVAGPDLTRFAPSMRSDMRKALAAALAEAVA